MKTRHQIVYGILFFMFIVPTALYSQGQLDPIRLSSLSVNAGVGLGTTYFGNGMGAGPALKGSAEKGMMDLGKGILTLGGEFTLSIFGHTYGDGYHESWTNFFFAARGAWHYGWDVEGLDTYAGIPVGIGFCAHSSGDKPGAHGYQSVFPYFGLFAGGSWFFNKQIGVNCEIGYNSTFLTLGAIYKIR